MTVEENKLILINSYQYTWSLCVTVVHARTHAVVVYAVLAKTMV